MVEFICYTTNFGEEAKQSAVDKEKKAQLTATDVEQGKAMKSTGSDLFESRTVKATPVHVMNKNHSYGSTESDEELVRGSICAFEEQAENSELKRIKGTNICKVEKTIQPVSSRGLGGGLGSSPAVEPDTPTGFAQPPDVQFLFCGFPGAFMGCEDVLQQVSIVLDLWN